MASTMMRATTTCARNVNGSVRTFATEKQLRMKIAATTNIAKITGSMKMVAAAKMKGDELRLAGGRLFGTIFERAFAQPADFQADPNYTAPEVPAGTLLLINSSDRGLCGGINSGISRAARNRLNELSAEGRATTVAIVGDKARSQLNRTHGQFFEAVIDEHSKAPITFDGAMAIAEKLVGTKASVVELLHNHYISAIKYEPVTKILPNTNAYRLEASGATPDLAPEHLRSYEFEPEDKAEALQSLFEFSLAGLLHTAIIDGNAAEQSSRMAAMDNASSNAKDMIERYKLAYNRARQSRITTELTEIVSGAEALNQ